MNLHDLADNAVRVYLTEKCSAADAVRKSCRGKGLTNEQVARVSGMTNKAILRHNKKSSAGSAPERFETSKADAVIDMSMAQPRGATTEDVLKEHHKSTEQQMLRLQGSPATAQGAPVDPPAVRDSVVGDSPTASGPASLDEVVTMLRRNNRPAMSDMGGDLERKVSFLRAATGIAPRESKVDTRDKLSGARVDRLVSEAWAAKERAGAKQLEARLKVSGLCTSLAHQISRLEKTSGFTLGELLSVVHAGMSAAKTSSAKDAFNAVFQETAEKARLDLDAAASCARDDEGQLKRSEIDTARARLSVRPEVGDAVDPNSSLYKAASDVAVAFEDVVVLGVAEARLAASALRGADAAESLR